jgi:hypothetical protein
MTSDIENRGVLHDEAWERIENPLLRRPEIRVKLGVCGQDPERIPRFRFLGDRLRAGCPVR